MDFFVMFYRWASIEFRQANPDIGRSKWRDQMVGDFNSEKTDGETYDLIKHYQYDGSPWEVVVVPVTLPA